jgi:hypothetical protein
LSEAIFNDEACLLIVQRRRYLSAAGSTTIASMIKKRGLDRFKRFAKKAGALNQKVAAAVEKSDHREIHAACRAAAAAVRHDWT